MRRLEDRGALQHRDPPLPGERLEPARQSPHHTLGPVSQRFGLDPRCAEIDAVLFERLDLVDEPSDVQERLRGDAADVQAHAPEVGIALDERGLLAEIGGAEGASVTPGDVRGHLREEAREPGRGDPIASIAVVVSVSVGIRSFP
jgi:hypothetical protein